MSYMVAFSIVLLSIVAAAATTWIVDRRIPLETRKGQHEVGSAVFAQLGIMASVLLAFVFAQVWQDYGAAASAIDVEVAALREMQDLSRSLPNENARAVDLAARAYAAQVVTVEWRAMSEGRSDPEAARRLKDLTATVAKVSGPPAVQSQLLELASSANFARAIRISQMSRVIPVVVWVMLFFLYSVLMVFVVLAATSPRGRLFIVMTFSASTMIVLMLVGLLDLPFEGSLALPSSAFLPLL